MGDRLPPSADRREAIKTSRDSFTEACEGRTVVGRPLPDTGMNFILYT